MTINEKKAYKIYLNKENVELVQNYLDRSKGSGGMSALIDEYIANMARTITASQLANGEKLGWAKLFKLFVNGLRNTKHIK